MAKPLIIRTKTNKLSGAGFGGKKVKPSKNPTLMPEKTTTPKKIAGA